jgi:hypothetical protein
MQHGSRDRTKARPVLVRVALSPSIQGSPAWKPRRCLQCGEGGSFRGRLLLARLSYPWHLAEDQRRVLAVEAAAERLTRRAGRSRVGTDGLAARSLVGARSQGRLGFLRVENLGVGEIQGKMNPSSNYARRRGVSFAVRWLDPPRCCATCSRNVRPIASPSLGGTALPIIRPSVDWKTSPPLATNS